MTIKRSSRENREVETLAMANCLKLLSRIGKTGPTPGRVFKCKTCNRQFKSFQALGGHRASHNKNPSSSSSSSTLNTILVLGSAADHFDQHVALGSSSKTKAKTHGCTVCGLEFAIGQALGGHMRKHRNDQTGVSEGSLTRSEVVEPPPADCLWLDLNLTPYENDLRINVKFI